jgi:predicted phosphodiesterase
VRIQVASDLHHELAPADSKLSMPLEIVDGVDVLILAGDIHSGVRAIDLYGSCPVPVVYVHGNNEAYDHKYPELVDELRRYSAGTAVQFLQNKQLIIGGVRFLGACMWTDYSSHPLQLEDALGCARRKVTEHKRMSREGNKFFQPEDACEHQRETLRFIAGRLDEPFCGRTVVVTHHAPSEMSIPHENRARVLAAAFASNVERLVLKADLWAHGHIHWSSDYRIGDCRVVCNARGAPGVNRFAPEIPYENRFFDSRLVVDL